MNYEFIYLTDENKDLFIEELSSFRDLSFSSYFVKNDFNFFKEYFGINNKTSFLLKSNNEILGIFLGATRNKQSYIVTVIVKDEYKNLGYGKIIIQKGVNLFYENGCEITSLEVMIDNHNAIHLYENEKFKTDIEVLHMKNEKNSFFTNDILYYNIQSATPAYLISAYNTFDNRSNIWLNDISSIYKLSQNKEYELQLLRNKETIEGFALIRREDNVLKINNLKINKTDDRKLSIFLSLLLKKEKIVQIKNIQTNENIVKPLLNLGFFIEKRQIHMTKNLL